LILNQETPQSCKERQIIIQFVVRCANACNETLIGNVAKYLEFNQKQGRIWLMQGPSKAIQLVNALFLCCEEKMENR